MMPERTLHECLQTDEGFSIFENDGEIPVETREIVKGSVWTLTMHYNQRLPNVKLAGINHTVVVVRLKKGILIVNPFPLLEADWSDNPDKPEDALPFHHTQSAVDFIRELGEVKWMV